MSLEKDGIIVILSSPSGAGKTTLVKKIAQENNFKISISYTTRKPRTHELNGKDYFFISNKKFTNGGFSFYIMWIKSKKNIQTIE